LGIVDWTRFGMRASVRHTMGLPLLPLTSGGKINSPMLHLWMDVTRESVNAFMEARPSFLADLSDTH
jgi:hypothetical protein